MEFALPLPLFETSASFMNWKCLQQRFKDSQQKQLTPSKLNMPTGPASLFIYIAGREIYEIVGAYISSENCEEETAVSKLVAEIENRCLPSFIVLYERFKFFRHQQKNSDSIRKFITELQWLAEYCEFQEDKEKCLLDGIIGGVQSASLRKELQNVEHLNLKNAIALCSEADNGGLAMSISSVIMKPKRGRKTKTFCAKKNEENLKSTKIKKPTKIIESPRKKERKKWKNKKKCNDSGNMKYVEEDLNTDKSNTMVLRRKTLIGSSARNRARKNSPRKTNRAKGKTQGGKNLPQIGSNSDGLKKHLEYAADSIFSPSLIPDACGTDSLKSEDAVTLTFVPEEDVMSEICSSTSFLLESTQKIEGSADHDRLNEAKNEKNSLCSSRSKRCKKCPICGGKFATTYLFKSHMRIHSDRRLYKCEICDMGFIHSGTRSRHMRQTHPELLKFRCDECDMLFELQTALDQHKLSHSKREEITCGDCGEVFMSTRDHYQHQRKRHRSTRYSCDICGLHFPYPSKLKLHLMTKHNATKPFMCEICGSSFAEKNLLANHKNIHSGERKHGCNQCGRRFLLKTTLNNHMQTHLDHKPHTCEVCGMNFKLSYYLKSHMKTHSFDRERPHTCSTCGASFFKSGQLRNHERKHTGEKPFKCDICNASFSQLSSMNKHIKHIHEGLKPKDRFSCEFCGLAFTHSCKLKLHLMKHTGERPFECKICASTYRENHQLISHMKIHSGDEPFKCDICGRKFLQKSYLEGHIRKHTGEKPFKCSVCNAGFTQKGYLRDHVKVHDQNRERKYKCSVCGKAFTCSSHMRSHERLHSGEKPHNCHLCGSRFTKRSSVKKHLKRTHGVHDSVSKQAQDPMPSIIQDPSVISDSSIISIAELQPVDISHTSIQTELHTEGLPDQSHICPQAHSNTHELQTHLTGHLRPESNLEMSSQMHSEIHPDLSAGVHTVQTSVLQQMHHLQGIHILHPELHHGLHSTIHPLIHSQIHPIMRADDQGQIEHPEVA